MDGGLTARDIFPAFMLMFSRYAFLNVIQALRKDCAILAKIQSLFLASGESDYLNDTLSAL